MSRNSKCLMLVTTTLLLNISAHADSSLGFISLFSDSSASNAKDSKKSTTSSRRPDFCPYDLELSGSYLYWKAAFSYLPIEATVQEIGTTGNQNEVHNMNLNYPYASGYKAGARFGFPNHKWNIGANWTTLFTTPSKTIKAKGSQSVLNPAQTDPIITASKCVTHGHIEMNVIDMDFGKSFHATRHTMVHLFAGTKLAWLKYAFKSKYYNPIASNGEIVTNVVNRFHDDIWGVGPRLAFNTEWFMGGSHFALVFNGAGSLLWQEFEPNFDATYVGDGDPYGNISNSQFHTMNFVTELFFGLEYKCCNSNFTFSLAAGYEVQYWFHQLANGTLLQTNSADLNIQGVTGSAAISF